MKVKVSQIDPNAGRTLEGILDAVDVDGYFRRIEGHRAAGPITYRLVLNRMGARVLLRGTLEGDVATRCRRCLEPIRYGLDIEGIGTFMPPEAEIREEELELTGNDLEEGHYVDDELDLTSWIYEMVELELKPYVLCREDCLGLCPQCGVNRNENPCDCAAQAIDPRWEGLLALKRTK